MGSSPTRGSSFFLGKVTALGVLCCFALFVCLTLLTSFFLPSHLYIYNGRAFCLDSDMHVYMECRGFKSHLRQLIFIWISDYLGCVVWLCFVVCMTLDVIVYHG